MASESNNQRPTLAEMAVRARADRPDAFDVSKATMRALQLKEKLSSAITVKSVAEIPSETLDRSISPDRSDRSLSSPLRPAEKRD